MNTMKENAVKAKNLILHAIPKIAAKDWTNTIQANMVRPYLAFLYSSIVCYAFEKREFSNRDYFFLSNKIMIIMMIIILYLYRSPDSA